MIEKLDSAIEKYLSAFGTNRQIAGAKGRLTKLVNDLADSHGAVTVREKVLDVLANTHYVSDRTELLKNRFTYGSLYQEGDRVYGWYQERDVQVQAEHLPLARSNRAYIVSFYGHGDTIGLWVAFGFAQAEALPTDRRGQTLYVEIKPESTPFWAKYGYAYAIELPCSRITTNEGVSMLVVKRSIIGSGFWKSYSWWAGCKWWYYDHHPEWFGDDPIWGDWEETPTFYYAPEPDSAVLGGRG